MNTTEQTANTGTYNNGFLRQEPRMTAKTDERTNLAGRKWLRRYQPEHEKKIKEVVSPLFNSGKSFREIAEVLNANGLVTANDQPWSQDSAASFIYARKNVIRKSALDTSTRRSIIRRPVGSKNRKSQLISKYAGPSVYNQIQNLKEEKEKLAYDLDYLKKFSETQKTDFKIETQRARSSAYFSGGAIGGGLMGLIWILVSVGGHFLR